MKTITGKMVVLGDQGVGKTSIVMRHVEKKYDPHISPTIGASFFTCNVGIDDITVKIQVWDTAGQERFKAMAPMFYRNANIALLVYDIIRPKTFENIKNWIQELKGNVPDPIIIYIIGNKIDLSSQRKVLKDEALQYANSVNATYYETSAAENQGLVQIFENAARGLVKLSGNRINQDDGESPFATASTLNATDTGVTETARWSISSIAHADSVRRCC